MAIGVSYAALTDSCDSIFWRRDQPIWSSLSWLKRRRFLRTMSIVWSGRPATLRGNISNAGDFWRLLGSGEN